MPDITVSDLEIMSKAVRYRRWLFEQVAGWVGSRVLEIGAGIGNYTEFLTGAKRIVCLDVHADALGVLRRRFGDDPRVVLHQGDVSSPDCRALAEHRCDSAICFNVLEHVEDDAGALENVRRILLPGSPLLLIVPALPAIFGTVDRALGHHRRYAPRSLRALLAAAGYQVERMRWMNLPGVLGWYLNNRVWKRTEESPKQITFFDRYFVPWLRLVEKVVPPPVGLSLVCVCRTPAAQCRAA
jgi:SAM-dependent methyltransferase